MKGKITVKRRLERSGHRLQARLRTPGLVRPGAAVETRPDALRYRGFKGAWGLPREFGWYRGRMAFRPNQGRRAFLLRKRLRHAALFSQSL